MVSSKDQTAQDGQLSALRAEVTSVQRDVEDTFRRAILLKDAMFRDATEMEKQLDAIKERITMLSEIISELKGKKGINGFSIENEVSQSMAKEIGRIAVERTLPKAKMNSAALNDTRKDK